LNLINEKIKTFDGTNTELFNFIYKTTGDLKLATDKTFEFVKGKFDYMLYN